MRAGSRRALARLVQGLPILGLLLLTCLPQPAWAQAFESRAPHAFLYDVNSRTVLYTQQADERFEPASMAKTLTTAVVFDGIAQEIFDLETTFPISEDAWRRGGGPSGRAAMFAELGSDIAIADLLRGLTIISGNDAAIALAEGVAGDEQSFAERMTQLAANYSANNSAFTNSTGQPEPGMYTTARDLVVITTALIDTHPRLYAMFGEDQFTWNDITQRNRNPIYNQIEGRRRTVCRFQR